MFITWIIIVLTAAHCVIKYRNSVALIIGINQRNSFSSENVYYTEGYVFNSVFSSLNLQLGNDIAIYKLNRRVIFSSTVSVACLPSTGNLKSVLDKTVIITGWGSTNGVNSQASLSNNLQQSTLKVLNNSPYNFDKNKLYCALDATRNPQSNVCNGKICFK